MGGEREIRPGIVDDFVDSGNQLRAARGRMQSSDQESVVTTRLASGCGAGCIATDSVGDQPLARFGRGEVTADLAAKLNFPLL
jgi:hypothetical protein